MNIGDRWALVLAGGKGTRLSAAIADRPKLLAPVGGRPFLALLVAMLARQGLPRLAFLLGFRANQIVPALEVIQGVQVQWSIEPEPLGTAGAVKRAQRFCTEDFFLVNGDTYLDFDAANLLAQQMRTDAAVTIAATRAQDAGRFGILDVDPDGRVREFREKVSEPVSGLINAGVYVIAPRVLDSIPSDRAVSLEREIFPLLLASGERLIAVEQQGAFFDIGTEASWRAFARFCADNERLHANPAPASSGDRRGTSE